MTPGVKRESGTTVPSRPVLNTHIFEYLAYLQFCCLVFAANKTPRGEINVIVKGDFPSVSLAAGVFTPGERFLISTTPVRHLEAAAAGGRLYGAPLRVLEKANFLRERTECTIFLTRLPQIARWYMELNTGRELYRSLCQLARWQLL